MVRYGWWNAVIVWWMVGCYVAVLATPGDRAFQWKFGGNFVATTFPECQNLSLVVESLDSNATAVGVGPYYLFAFEVGGIPTVTMIGTNPNNLTWQNTHRGGSSLMLTILDSQQSTGGVAPIIYNVTGGADRSCLPAISSDMQPPVIPAITSNLTGTMETCQPWGLTVSGGAKPYQIVLSALQSITITNSSMGINDDVYTYIDRADPGELLMASVVDANGRWGISSSLILPQGSNDTSCVGLVSSTKTSAQIQQEAQARAAAEEEKHNHHQHVAIGVGVGVGVGGFIILLVGLWLFIRRRARRNDGVWDSQDIIPRAWHQQDATADMQERQHTPPPLSASSISNKPSYSPTEPLPDTGVLPLPMARVYPDRGIEGALTSNTTLTSGSMSIPQTSSTQPTSARERKLREASGQHSPSTPSGLHTTTTPPASASSPSFSASTNRVDARLNRDSIQPDIIIQHRDAGTGIVQELPPPYADRTAPAPDVPS